MNYRECKTFIDFCKKELQISVKIKWRFKSMADNGEVYAIQNADQSFTYFINIDSTLPVPQTFLAIAHELTHIYQDLNNLCIELDGKTSLWRYRILYDKIDFDGKNHREYNAQPHEKHANAVAYKLWRKYKRGIYGNIRS